MPNKLLLTVTQPSRHWFAAPAVALAVLVGLSGLWTAPVEAVPPADQKNPRLRSNSRLSEALNFGPIKWSFTTGGFNAII